MENDLLHLAVEAVSAKKAQNPILLNIAELSPLVDYFLICSGQTGVHVRSIADHLEREIVEAGQALLHKEGGREARWVLLDFGWLVAHVMQEEEREFYQLERLWHDAEAVSLAAELRPL